MARHLDTQARGEDVSFTSELAEFSGRFSVSGPADFIFELFSPHGERAWVPNWNPRTLHPPDGSWQRGQIFLTQEEQGEAVWIVTGLNRQEHDVEYHRVEPGRYVARVRVRCTDVDGGSVEVVTSYAFVGLSPEGNDEIAAMTRQAYDAKMTRWQRWIGECLSRGR
jgi:hypothetical protein